MHFHKVNKGILPLIFILLLVKITGKNLKKIIKSILKSSYFKLHQTPWNRIYIKEL